jgi:hypothetical protein
MKNLPSQYDVSLDLNKLDPYFVTGFCDAESSFSIFISKKPENITG